ncbi:hypothetical protein I6A84_17215, partial [Frankia sp. CNm7]|nr:hypothetical protein [Frankia nepalensis]
GGGAPPPARRPPPPPPPPPPPRRHAWAWSSVPGPLEGSAPGDRGPRGPHPDVA